MKKYFVFIAFIAISSSASAQYKLSDFSIIKPSPKFYDTLEMLKTMPESVERAMLESKAFTFYFYSNSDSALYFAKRVEAFAKKNDIKAMLVYHQLFIGTHYSNIKGNYALGLYYINLSKSEAKEYGLSDKFFDGTSTMMQLMSYAGLGSFSKVKKMLANEGSAAVRDAYIKENTWTPEGMIGQIFGSIKEYDSAIKYATLAININDTMPLALKWGFPYIVLSDAYNHKKEYQKALNILIKGAKDIKTNNFEKDIAESMAISAEAHLGLKNYDSAIYYANAAYKLSSIVKLTNTILNASNILTKIYTKTNKIDSAFKYLTLSNAIKDDISDKSKLNEIENITINEELRQKQKEEEETTRKKLIIGFSLFFIVGFTSLTIYNRQKQKNRIRQIEEDRKNKELEAAKELQISLLPKTNPNRPDLDIATYIRSSTEVGGDYYDFEIQNDGTIISICGDATGHGVASGMMVSVTKAGLKGIGIEKPSDTLHKLNNVVKEIELGTLRMSLNLVKITADTLEISSAAMPPVYLYKASTMEVEEILIKGLPLGGLKNIDFDSKYKSFNSGDVLVQLSDGLPEAPNSKGEMYDYDQLKNLIQASCHLTAQEIIDTLIKSVDAWLEGQNNPDDITLVITKKK